MMDVFERQKEFVKLWGEFFRDNLDKTPDPDPLPGRDYSTDYVAMNLEDGFWQTVEHLFPSFPDGEILKHGSSHDEKDHGNWAKDAPKGTKLDLGKSSHTDELGNRVWVLGRLVIPKESQGEGHGSKIMERILADADKSGATVSLTPDSKWGGSKARLISWYKSMGFVQNKGRNRDFKVSESMFRYPSKVAKHGDDTHDEKDHGNWSDGEKVKPRRKFTLPVKEKKKTGQQKLPGLDVPRADTMQILGFEEDDWDNQSEFREGAYDNWTQWQGSKDIRTAALKHLGIEDLESLPGDPHIDSLPPASGGWTESDQSIVDKQALFFMDQLVEGQKHPELYRAVDIGTLNTGAEETLWGSISPGDEFDAPLLAFLNHHPEAGDQNLLELFGNDVLLKVEGATGYDSGTAFTSPFWSERDERDFLYELKEAVEYDIGIFEDDPDYGPEDASYSKGFLQSIIDYEESPTKDTRSELREWVTEGTVFTPKFFGDKIDEAEDSDAYYEWFDYPDSAGTPREVISGGRFRVKSVEEGTGVFGQVVTIEQVGVFDPLNGELVSKIEKKDKKKKSPLLLTSEQFSVGLKALQDKGKKKKVKKSFNIGGITFTVRDEEL